MNNVERLRAHLAAENLPAVLISNLGNVQWLSGFTGSSALAVVTADDGVFLTDSRYTLQAREEVVGLPVATFATPQTLDGFLAEHVQRLGIDRLGFESETATFATHARWSEKLAGVELVPLKDIVEPLRAIKQPDEIARIRRACALSDACLEHVQRLVQPGVSEWDILMEIEFFMRRQGAEVSFHPIVVSGPRSARPHGVASERKLEVGDFLTLDLGALVDGYCSDITRTFVVGEATDRHREIYDQVLKAQEAAIAALVPGANGRDIDALAREILEEKGMAQYFGHGLGHGLGRLVHDTGRLTKTVDQPIEVGQVWTVEPGVYIEGFGGVRIEDDVLVTESGPEILTRFPKQLLVLPA